jgi:hypothetical protein
MEQAQETSDAMPPRSWSYSIYLILMLGVGLRTYHYLRNPGVWMDELFLLRNIVGKSYSELLGPLVCDQAAPPLFLWIEHSVWLLLGDSPLALRLVPLLTSCGALLLLLPVARAFLRPAAIPWALLLFACSDKIVDHTVEAKQYLMDSFVTVLVPAVFFATRQWSVCARLYLFAAIAPLVIFLSFPGCFVMGGLVLAMLPEVWQERRRPAVWFAYVVTTLASAAAFGLLLMGPIRAQHTMALADMWTCTFPNWSEPWTVPWWCLKSNVLLLDHSFRPLGGGLTPFAVLGVVSLWRRGCKTELALIAGPVALSMLAALFWKYPYSSRVMLFAVAPLALLVAEGFVQIMTWTMSALQDKTTWARLAAARTLMVAAFVLVLLPTALSAIHVVKPWSRLVFPWPERAAAAPQSAQN